MWKWQKGLSYLKYPNSRLGAFLDISVKTSKPLTEYLENKLIKKGQGSDPEFYLIGNRLVNNFSFKLHVHMCAHVFISVRMCKFCKVYESQHVTSIYPA